MSKSSKNPWPEARSSPPEPFHGTSVIWTDVSAPQFHKYTTSCKHGHGDCEVCGTSERVDKKHSTIGGKGHVARLREKK